jgi:hypothetical protein
MSTQRDGTCTGLATKRRWSRKCLHKIIRLGMGRAHSLGCAECTSFLLNRQPDPVVSYEECRRARAISNAYLCVYSLGSSHLCASVYFKLFKFVGIPKSTLAPRVVRGDCLPINLPRHHCRFRLSAGSISSRRFKQTTHTHRETMDVRVDDMDNGYDGTHEVLVDCSWGAAFQQPH